MKTSRMTSPIITSSDLAKASEHFILHLACVLYELDHPAESGRDAVALHIAKSRSHLDQCIAGQAHIGAEAWLRIEGLINRPLFHEWLNTKEVA